MQRGEESGAHVTLIHFVVNTVVRPAYKPHPVRIAIAATGRTLVMAADCTPGKLCTTCDQLPAECDDLLVLAKRRGRQSNLDGGQMIRSGIPGPHAAACTDSCPGGRRRSTAPPLSPAQSPPGSRPSRRQSIPAEPRPPSVSPSRIFENLKCRIGVMENRIAGKQRHAPGEHQTHA